MGELTPFLEASVRLAVPLALAALGEAVSEKAGVINLSMEGSLRLSAMVGFVAAFFAGNALVGFGAAMAVGALVAALIAFGNIKLKINQIALGFVLFLLGVELASFLGDPFVGERGQAGPPRPSPGRRSRSASMRAAVR